MAAGPVLVVGGDRDPNISHLVAALRRAQVGIRVLEYGADHRPWIAWDLERDELIVEGAAIEPAAVFIRHDVFTALADDRPAPRLRALAWTTALHGYALAHPDLRYLNRDASASNKPHNLIRARALGLDIPRTLICNHGSRARAAFAGPAIAKPVAGGDLTRPLDEALALAGDVEVPAAPALIQERLVPPELRIYVVGEWTGCFEVRSPHLDYRAAAAELIWRGPGPEPLTTQIRALARELGLDYAAADLKTRPETDELLFLEINSAPMFARFDAVSEGALCAALIDWLAPRR